MYKVNEFVFRSPMSAILSYFENFAKLSESRIKISLEDRLILIDYSNKEPKHYKSVASRRRKIYKNIPRIYSNLARALIVWALRAVVTGAQAWSYDVNESLHLHPPAASWKLCRSPSSLLFSVFSLARQLRSADFAVWAIDLYTYLLLCLSLVASPYEYLERHLPLFIGIISFDGMTGRDIDLIICMRLKKLYE